ncbi:hypothetical protein GCM10022234_08510 [Aeromicrobium panaciterrae]|uniref:hypothetical protein n=1 Tax=Aeromicrobium panaciterrae TaxID=363861 RepID=UPI0031DB9934
MLSITGRFIRFEAAKRLAAGFILALAAGCGVAPTSPEAPVIGVRISGGQLQHAVRLCEGESLTSFRVLSSADGETVWTSTGVAPAKDGLQVTVVPYSVIDSIQGDRFELEFDSKFAGGPTRTAGSEWKLNEIPSLDGDQWFTSEDERVDSSAFKAVEC